MFISLLVRCFRQPVWPEALAGVLCIHFNIQSEAHTLRIRRVEYLMTIYAVWVIPILNAWWLFALKVISNMKMKAQMKSDRCIIYVNCSKYVHCRHKQVHQTKAERTARNRSKLYVCMYAYVCIWIAALTYKPEVVKSSLNILRWAWQVGSYSGKVSRKIKSRI